ncbi:MAG TPA: CPBP family intramembrane metalloprotease [Candidatus Atribacteria bacterium]|nr:CPBP family intramembrane metalloprotease [Candidatus Atribacteria bacterium]HPT78644.1 CPBP family intramembrane metalloprotease [Candidatus Atribacteria bacterium]
MHLDKEEQKTIKHPTPLAAGLLYLIVLVLMLLTSFLLGGYKLKGNSYYAVMLVVQLAVILVPPLVYMLYANIDIKRSARLNRISIPELFLTAGMAVFGYGAIIPINLIWYYFLSRFGTPRTPEMPPIETPAQYLMALIVIALVPALIEEFLFRGTIMRGYEKYSRRTSVLLTGLLFSLLHLQVMSLPSILLMGILLSYIVNRSNTIFTGVVYHFVNNAIAVTIAFLTGILNKLLPITQAGVPDINDITQQDMIAAIIVWLFLGAVSFVLFSGCLAGFYFVTKDKQEKAEAAAKRPRAAEVIPVLVSVVIIAALLVLEIFAMAGSAA